MFKNNKVILLFLLAIIAFVGYNFMFKKDSSSRNSDLVADSTEEVAAQSSVGKDLIINLSKLKSLDLDENFFKDPIFNSLNDFSVPIASQNVGRTNPFSPISGMVSSDGSGVSKVKN